MTACPVCDTAIDRNARLALQLRKVTIRVHAQGQHGGEWRQCADPLCVASRGLLHEHDLPRMIR